MRQGLTASAESDLSALQQARPSRPTRPSRPPCCRLSSSLAIYREQRRQTAARSVRWGGGQGDKALGGSAFAIPVIGPGGRGLSDRADTRLPGTGGGYRGSSEHLGSEQRICVSPRDVNRPHLPLTRADKKQLFVERRRFAVEARQLAMPGNSKAATAIADPPPGGSTADTVASQGGSSVSPDTAPPRRTRLPPGAMPMVRRWSHGSHPSHLLPGRHPRLGVVTFAMGSAQTAEMTPVSLTAGGGAQ